MDEYRIAFMWGNRTHIPVVTHDHGGKDPLIVLASTYAEAAKAGKEDGKLPNSSFFKGDPK